MTDRQPDPNHRRLWRPGRRVIALLSFPATLTLFGFASLAAGQDYNGDTFAFHTSWLWTLFNEDQDPAWAVGGPGGLVPSLWNVPWYFLALNTPAEVVIFYLGALHGVVIWLTGAIAWTVLHRAGQLRLPVTLIVTLFGFLAPGTLTEFGTTFGNLTTAGFVLGAILVYVRGPVGGVAPRRAMVIGALLGAAVGLKLTNAIWLTAALIALMATERGRGRSVLRRGAAALSGVAAGALLTGGYWWLAMWSRFDNPLFPFYNRLFGSDYGWQENFRDDRFLVGPVEAVAMPFRMAVGLLPSENVGRDVRWAIIAELALVAVLVSRLRARHPTPRVGLVRPRDRTFLLIFSSVGWTTWLLQFGIHRYLIVLELLSGLLLVLLLDLAVRSDLWRTVAVALVPVLAGALVVAPVWPHRQWGDSWFEFRTPAVAQQQDMLVVLPRTYLLGHALAAMPAGTVAVTVPHIFKVKRSDPPRYSRLADREVRRAIASHEGPVVGLTYWKREPFEEAQRIAATYGLRFDRSDCSPMRSSLGRFAACSWRPVQRR